MRTLPLLLAVLVGLSGCVGPAPDPAPLAPRALVGVLQGETVLEGQVVLEGDVLVPAGSTLVIRAGTRVSVRYSDSTKIDPEYLSPATELLVRGTLRVEGSAKDPVRFLPTGVPEGEAVGWAGIIFDRAEGGDLEGLVVRGAETGVWAIASSPTIRTSLFTGCRYGLVADAGSAPQVFASRFEDGEGGIYCWRGSAPVIEGSRIAGNEEEGVFADPSCHPVLKGSEVRDNAVGLAFYGAAPDFDPSAVRGNGVDIRRLDTPPEAAP